MFVYKVVNNININYTIIKKIIILTILPDSLDLAPRRDQLISIDNSFVIITPEIDTIATSGSAGSINYRTTSRFK